MRNAETVLRRRRSMLCASLLALTVLGAAAVAVARPSEYEPGFVEVTRQVVTPHVPWARPYHRGAVRALMIAPRGCMRDTVELAQRLELDYDVVGTYLRDQLGGGDDRVTRIVGVSPDDVTQRLLDALAAPHDVIVVGNIHWRILPREVEYEILRQVRAGTGLVLTYHDEGRNEHLQRALDVASEVDDDGFITHALPLRWLPAWKGQFETHDEAAEAVVDTRKFGEGRIALLNLGHNNQTWLVPSTADEHAWAWEHRWPLEHYLMLTARAVAWAARMEPDVRLARCEIAGDEPGAPITIPGQQPAVVLELTGGREGELTAEVTVRDTSGRLEAQVTGTVTAAAGEMRLPIDAELTDGRHFAEVVVRDGGQAVTWGGASALVEWPRRFESVTRGVEQIDPGGTAVFEAALDGPAPADARVSWRVRDGLRRLLHESVETLPEGAEAGRLEVKVERPLSNVLVAEATLEVGGRAWARQRASLPVDLGWPADEFSFLMWGKSTSSYVWAYLRDIFHEMGVDTVNHGGARETAAHGLRTLPAQRLGLHPNEATVEDLVRSPCFSDPAHRERSAERLRQVAESRGGYGPPGYTLGDDNRLGSSDICFSEHCLADLRRWLRERYETLDALNEQWGTAFEAWANVMPTTLAEARESDQPSRWIDHRMHMETVYADFHAFARDVVREVDPGARVGSDAAIGHGSFGGYDWWKYSRAVDVWNVYVNHLRVECLRSFKRPNTYCGLWYGGYNHRWRFEEGCRWVPWYSLLHGLNSAWWFKTHSDARQSCQEDAFAADLSAFPIFEATADAIAEIKAGIDRLILGAERDHCGIAIVYSQPSLHAGTYEGDGVRHERAVSAASTLVEDLGLEHNLVSYAQLGDGSWGADEYDVLVLPEVTALSAAAREEIAAFVEGGGTLIADMRPGVRDGHGRPLDDPAWQELLGVSVGALDGRTEGQPATIAGEIGGGEIDVALQPAIVDASVSADGARALGAADDGTPVCLLAERGAGRTCLLNVPLAGYAADSEDGAALRQVVSALLREAGASAFATVEVADGALLEGETVCFTDGGAHYVAVLRHHTPEAPVQAITVHLPQGFAVYDVRAGEHLGRVTSVDAELGEGELLLLALLPARVEAIELTPREDRRAPGETIAVRARVRVAEGRPSRHVLRTTVTAPDGRTPRYYAEDLVTDDGAAVAHVPLALSDLPGTWRLRVRDVATGVSAQTSIEVAR